MMRRLRLLMFWLNSLPQIVLAGPILTWVGKKRIWVGSLLVVIGLSGIFYYGIVYLPRHETQAITNPTERVNSASDVRQTNAYVIAGFVGFIVLSSGAFFTYRNWLTSHEGQLTERFTRAIEHLGSEKLEIRLGGIYALERIARDSERDHGPVFEVLTAFIREHWPTSNQTVEVQTNRAATDLQAALTVIGRRTRWFGHGELMRLDLHDTDLRKTDLREAHLESARLSEAHLGGALLYGAYLQSASLFDAHLEGANLIDAHLEGANLRSANLGGAFLDDGHLEGANLYGAILSGAYLTGAHLGRAYLDGAQLYGADLRGAFLGGAHLAGVLGLTREQMKGAIADRETVLPNHIPSQDGQLGGTHSQTEALVDDDDLAGDD